MPQALPLPTETPVPEWHRRILEERLEAHKADPGAARPWDEVQAEITETLKQRRSR